MEHIIECNNLTHYYGKRLIYENLSFTVPKGRILGLLGKNGTGKTTTINILSGYLKPRSGECRISPLLVSIHKVLSPSSAKYLT